MTKRRSSSERKPATPRVPAPGDVYLSPLREPAVHTGALGDDHLGAVRVLRVTDGSALVATTRWLGREAPVLDDPLLRQTVVNRRFFFRGEPALTWRAGPLSPGLVRLGVLPPTRAEASLECGSHSGGWFDHCAQDALLEWRWENDRAALESEAAARRAAPPPARPARRTHAPMAERTFWGLIARLDWSRAGDDEAVCRPLVDALARRPVKAIVAFEERLADLLYALDGEAWAREIGEHAYRGPGSYLSADLFLYVRLCAVANGRALYAAALRDPRRMPKDLEFEVLLSVAREAYEKKTGLPWEGHLTFRNRETFSNAAGWPSLRPAVAQSPRTRRPAKRTRSKASARRSGP